MKVLSHFPVQRHLFAYAFILVCANTDAQPASTATTNASATGAGTVTVTPLDDTNFRAALDLYKTNESAATAVYGDIAVWDVSRVRDMSELELGADFLADLSAWNVSGVTDMAEVK